MLNNQTNNQQRRITSSLITGKLVLRKAYVERSGVDRRWIRSVTPEVFGLRSLQRREVRLT